MSHVDPDVLAGIALDPAEAPVDARDHLASCAACSALLEDLAAVRRLADAEPLVAPPARVRDAVLAELGAGASGHARVAPVALPAPPRRPARVPAWAAAVAAAVTLVAGLGIGRLTAADPAPARDDATAVVASTALTALDSDAPRGKAEAVRDRGTVTLRVRARDLGDEAGFHEVWLINLDGIRMVALGVLTPGDDGEFDVPRGLLDEGYRIVDISVEPDDGDPTHSGVSLARGQLGEA